MKIRQLSIAIGLLVCAVFMIGCGSANGTGAIDNAVGYLNAINDGDIDGARQYLCESRMDELVEGLEDTSDAERQDFSFQNIQCQAQGDNVTCSYSIVQDRTDEDEAPQD